MHSDHRIDPDSAIEIDDPAARQTGFDTARRFDQQASQDDGGHNSPYRPPRQIGTFLHGHGFIPCSPILVMLPF
jgi:hypothetical protein